MPSRTLEDKVEELTKLAATHAQQLQSLHEALKAAKAEHVEVAKAFGDLKNTFIRLEQLKDAAQQRKLQPKICYELFFSFGCFTYRSNVRWLEWLAETEAACWRELQECGITNTLVVWEKMLLEGRKNPSDKKSDNYFKTWLVGLPN